MSISTIRSTSPFKEVVVWAIDPFQLETRPDPSLIKKLLDLLRLSNIELQPVYILTWAKNSTKSVFERERLADDVAEIEQITDRYLLDLGVDVGRPVKVIFAASSSIEDEVDALLKFAEQQNSPFIAVSSHDRSGLRKFVLGSFAESLLLRSQYPILLLTHLHCALEQSKHFNRALFATDFSDSSYQAFLRFLIQAQRFHFEICLFFPEPQSKARLKKASEIGARWVAQSQSLGVDVRLVIKGDGVGHNAGKRILSATEEEEATLIVMALQDGPVSSFLTGRVAHTVFRSNRYPVWIYGPRALNDFYHAGESLAGKDSREASSTLSPPV